MKALPKSLAKQADEDRAFSDWLKLEGAHPIKEKGPWFDEDGLFLPDEFFAVLKSKGLEVESLKTEDKRQRWGATLKAMIFEDRQLRNLMLFDNSPQAQLVRCLLPAGSNMQTELKVEGPQWHKGPQAFQAKAHLDVAAWRGEVSLFQFELPDRSKAKPIAPSYKAYDGSTRTFDFGKLSLCLSAKAWGFAGASLLLARDLTLDQKTGFTSIAGYDSATKTGDLAKFDRSSVPKQGANSLASSIGARRPVRCLQPRCPTASPSMAGEPWPSWIWNWWPPWVGACRVRCGCN
ncbi:MULTISPECIES: hypothetical protein [Pseudomonas]|uniref:hypothetical protein n=1 Tax=Pseudomonadaceae TaxID=135621 RepID=UPI00106ECF91|nr:MULTISPECIES: hypothetical protein [Pseudomonas]